MSTRNLFSRVSASMSGNHSAASTSGKKPAEKPTANTLTLRVPNVFQRGDSVLLMSASHRGDMYHFRAALQIESFSVILYDSNHDDEKKTKTQDLEEYLAESVIMKGKQIFIVPWEFDVLRGKKPLPTTMAGCFLNGQSYNKQTHPLQALELNTYSEKASTQIVATAPDGLKNVINGMTILSKNMVSNQFPDFKHLSQEFPTVSTEFKKLWAQWKDAGVKAGENAVLLMYRDTGTRDPAPVEKMGVYPELDNGKATNDILDLVGEIATKEKSPLTIFTCGLEGSGIGEYWKALGKLKPDPSITKRDFEAYFLRWSYENGYFKMATGFRSGPLDLFTFMGIPTVSIGLRNLMGEPRHQLLAHEKFKRVNIQYDQPRHTATAAVASSRRKGSLKPYETNFWSPFWDEGFTEPENAKKRAIPNDTKREQMQQADKFATFDRTVVEIGYRFAFEKHMNLKQTISTLKANLETKKNELPRTITTSEARFCYPHQMLLSNDKVGLNNYFDAKEKLDYDAVQAIRQRAAELQLSETMIKKYEQDYDGDWDEVTKFINAKKILAPKFTARTRKWKIANTRR
jgi:hypothetical protein